MTSRCNVRVTEPTCTVVLTQVQIVTMSTRAPFFSSGARQEPRANGDLQEKASVQLSGDQTNALHCDQDMLADTPEKDTDDVNNNPSAETNIQHKPLNVNGLIRSRTYPKPPQRILLNGGNIPRPGTADLKSDGQHFVPHTTTIAAPMPFKASRIAPPLLLNPSNTSRPVSPLNFKAPAPPYIHQNGESFSNNAHIPTDSQDSSHEDLTVQLRSINSLGASRNMAASILAGKDANNTGHRIQYTQGKRRQNDANNGGQLDQYAKHLKRFKGDNSLVRRDVRIMRWSSYSTLSYKSYRAINLKLTRLFPVNPAVPISVQNMDGTRVPLEELLKNFVLTSTVKRIATRLTRERRL